MKRNYEKTRIHNKAKKIQAEMAIDAKDNFVIRLEKGKNEILKAKWSIWEEFVKQYSEMPYLVKTIDVILYYLHLLNSNTTLPQITSIFLNEYPEVGDKYTLMLLSNIAIFHDRGIELFENLLNVLEDKGINTNNYKKYFKKLRKINLLLEEQIDYDTAYTLADKLLITINIDDKKYIGFKDTDGSLLCISEDCANLLISNTSNKNYTLAYIINQNGEYKKYLYSRKDNKNVVQIMSKEGKLLNQKEFTLYGSAKKTKQNLAIIFNNIKSFYSVFSPVKMLEIYKEIKEFEQPIVEGDNTLTIEAIMYLNQNKVKSLKKEVQ